MPKGNDTDRYVQPNKVKGGWDVLKEARGRVSFHAATKAEAVKRAREIVTRLGGGEIRTKTLDGKFGDSITIKGPKQAESKAKDGAGRKPAARKAAAKPAARKAAAAKPVARKAAAKPAVRKAAAAKPVARKAAAKPAARKAAAKPAARKTAAAKPAARKSAAAKPAARRAAAARPAARRAPAKKR